MWTPRHDGTNRHSGRKFNNLGPKGGPRHRFGTGDPAFSFYFKLEVTGIVIAHFQEVSGLTWETEVVPFKEGGLNEYEHKLFGQTKYTNLVLKNGVTDNRSLWQWRTQAINARSQARKDGSITLLGSRGEQLQRWNFFRGWPCKWEGPAFNGGQNALAIETVEIAYDRLEHG